MKKILLTLASVALVLLLAASCTEEDIQPTQADANDTLKPIAGNIR